MASSAPLSVDLSGQRITGGVSGNSPVAPYSFNIGANYEHPLGRIFEGLGGVADVPVTAFVYGNLAWKYKTQLSQPGSFYSVFQPSYSIVNFGIGLRTDDDRYSLHFWAKNSLRPAICRHPDDRHGHDDGLGSADGDLRRQRFPRLRGDFESEALLTSSKLY